MEQITAGAFHSDDGGKTWWSTKMYNSHCTTEEVLKDLYEAIRGIEATRTCQRDLLLLEDAIREIRRELNLVAYYPCKQIITEFRKPLPND